MTLPRGIDDRRGFALITVLWLITALAVVAGAALATAREGAAASRNRLILMRARWAGEGCLEVAQARYAADSSPHSLDSLDLGSGVWCRAELTDPDARLDLNLAGDEQLRRLIGNDSLTDALLDWRDADSVPHPHGAEAETYTLRRAVPPRNAPLADPAELAFVRGFDSTRVAALARLITTRGTGRVDLATAPAEVLATLPGASQEFVDRVLDRRRIGRIGEGLDALLGDLSPPARQLALHSYRELQAVTEFTPARLVALVEGHVGQGFPVYRETVTLAPVAARLALIRRESE